jgi:hypothetical protein
MAEPTENVFSVGARIVSTAKEINGQMGVIKWIGTVQV